MVQKTDTAEEGERFSYASFEDAEYLEKFALSYDTEEKIENYNIDSGMNDAIEKAESSV